MLAPRSTSQRDPGQARSRRSAPGVERLEARQLLATFTVRTLADGGSDSLRQAILDANAAAGPDLIAFNIPGPGPFSIPLASRLPEVTDPVTIDGTTQPGSAGRPVIEINGAAAGFSVGGLVVNASGSTVRGLVINRFTGVGLAINGASGVTVAGNQIGTDPAGILDQGNGQGGIRLTNARNVTIGGRTPVDRNLISGNEGVGISVSDVLGIPGGNALVGNLIGTDLGGTRALPNNGAGILLNASGNQVGGTGPGEGNTIAFNGAAGVQVGQSNFTQGVESNAIRGNALFGNAGLGIDLGGSGVSFNDTGDFDTGPNRLQNFPALNSSYPSGGGTTVEGQLDSTSNSSFTIDFYSNDSPDPSGFGEGQRYLGSAAVTTDTAGRADFVAVLPTAVAPGLLVTATATDRNSNTSEFSRAGTVTPAPLADLAIRLDDAPDPVRVGQDLTYSIVVTNDGPSRATGVTVTDALPLGVTFVSAAPSQGTTAVAGGVLTASLGDLRPGEGATVQVVVRPTSVGTISNTASVRAAETDSEASDNTVSENSTVIPAIPADLAVSQFASAPQGAVGEDLTFTVVITNNGPNDAATGVILSDTLPSGAGFVSATPSQGTVAVSGGTLTADLGTLLRGGTATVQITVRPTTPGTLTNRATVRGDQTDPSALNNTVSLDILVTPSPAADLAVVQVAIPDPVSVGQALTYTISIGNVGPGQATGVIVTDELPSNVAFVSATPSQGTVAQADGRVTADLGTLIAGQVALVTVVVRPSALGTVTNLVTVQGSRPDFDPSNNRSTIATQVVGPAFPAPAVDLGVLQVGIPDPVSVGRELSYTISVGNAGPGQATGVIVTDELPANSTFVSAAASQGSVAQADGRVTADLGTLIAGQVALVTVVVRPSAFGTATNTVTVQGSQLDFEPSNNRSVIETRVVEDAIPPTILSQRLIASPREITGVVLTFSQELDPVLAEALNNYGLRDAGRDGQTGTADGPSIPLASARYDARRRTVTLTPQSPLSLGRFFQLTVNGPGSPGLTDATGNVLDGDQNGLPDGIFETLIGRGTRRRPQPFQRDQVVPRPSPSPSPVRQPRPRPTRTRPQPSTARLAETILNLNLVRRRVLS